MGPTIVIIKKQVIQVRDILKDTQTAKQAERVERKKAQQAQKREGREEKSYPCRSWNQRRRRRRISC